MNYHVLVLESYRYASYYKNWMLIAV